MAPIVVDTSEWAEYYRRAGSPEGMEVRRLLEAGEVVMVGIVYAELLRGARTEKEFRDVEEELGALPFLETNKETWKGVGRLLADFRQRGLPVPLPDAVIAILALDHGYPVFTRDEHFRRIPGLQLHPFEISEAPHRRDR